VGSTWVEGSERHYIASNGVEYAETGSSTATPPSAVAGSVWVEGEDNKYLDASGVERNLSRTSEGAKAAPAIAGSQWLNSPSPAGQQVKWITGSNKQRWHNGF
jgi:hypothetical protein